MIIKIASSDAWSLGDLSLDCAYDIDFHNIWFGISRVLLIPSVILPEVWCPASASDFAMLLWDCAMKTYLCLV